ncbi:HD-GYP domain-containing protein [Phycisphaerales bacterium AB-hyl4]|uniref:HD-GYP domain-containing protein n=1 Tax=Natronomicrosphaera hydrolytica TaxID=3242702 RepID=A0ABV4U8M9_9BACT
MLRIDVAKAKPGMKLALPVQNPQVPSRTLLKVSYELSTSVIKRLLEQGIRSIWVRYPSLDFLKEIIDAETVRNQSELVSQVSGTFESLQAQATAKLPYDTYTKSLQQLVDHLISHPNSIVFLGDISDATDDLMRHSSSVTYLTLLMGLKLDGYLVKERKHVAPARAKEVANLGLGAMLHDVGVTQLPAEVSARYKREADESDPGWQEHPAMGFRMVRSDVDPSAATVVLNHHQYFDGSGYSGQDFPTLTGRNIHVFARITAVADQFDLLRNPANLPAQPTAWVLNAMVTEPLRARFDPTVLRALLAVVPPYPPGSVVKLSDGQFAVCIDHNAHDPCRPKVQIIPDPATIAGGDLPLGPSIDLSEQPETLFVAEHDGKPVSEFNFTLPLDLASETARSLAWA